MNDRLSRRTVPRLAPHPRRRRFCWCGGFGNALMLPLALALVAGGCQRYERKPLDLAGHHAAFLARTPASPEVQQFSQQLAAQADTLAAGFDFSDGVNCPEAEAIALVFNAELRLARLRAGVTRATAENSGLWEDPTLGVDLTRIIQSTPEPWKVFSTIGLTIPISGRLEFEKDRAGAELAAELARVEEREWMTRIALRKAWTEWSAVDAQLASARDFLSRVDQVLDVVDKMEQAGEMPRTEARLFRIERATRAAELAALESRTIEASLRLRQLMGLSPDANIVLQSSGIGPPLSLLEPADDLASGYEIIESRSLALAVAKAEYESAERSLELDIRKQYPDLHVGPGYGREDGQDQVLLGLSVPMPIFNGNRRGIAEARAKREAAREAAHVMNERLIAEVRAAQVRLRAAETRRTTIESEIVPLVDAQYADARRVAQLGEVNTLVLLESLTRQQEAKVSLIEARRDESLARIDVQTVVGPTPATANPAGEVEAEAAQHENTTTRERP